MMNKFVKIAQKTLIGNRKKGYTLPTNNKLYPAQWNWDSAFIALGYSYFNLNFALKEIKKCISKIKKAHEWFIKYRDPKKTGLVSILHPWESGYDNSSLWDGPMSKVKIEKNIQYKRADNKVVNPEHRPLNIDYDRYVTIKNDLRKKKYNPKKIFNTALFNVCLLYTSPSPRDLSTSRMPSSA